jgi:hypothetical protein
MSETVASLILIVVIIADIVLQRLEVRHLRKKLLEFAAKAAQSSSEHEIKIECDNSDAMIKLAEVERAAHAAAAAIQNMLGSLH